MKGQYGEQYAEYLDNTETYDITLCQAPCAEPGCCCISMFCFCCAQVHMRHKALNHVYPGSEWSKYICCQNYFGGCCCIQPGKLGEQSCPVCCMCMESLCCAGMAVSATSGLIRDKYQLGLDADDIKLIRLNNCIQMIALVANVVSMFADWDGEEQCIQCINLIANAVFCSTAGCMTAQVYHEINLRENPEAPESEVMERLL